MSLFGSRLRTLVEDSDMTVYRLAEITGIERTSIHKIMSAGRIPAIEAAHKLSKALQLPAQEHESFIELYFMSKIGLQQYNQRKQVKTLIEAIADLDIRKIGASHHALSKTKNHRFEAASKTVDAGYAVDALISDVLLEAVNSKGHITIEFVISEDYGYFYNELLSLCNGSKKNIQVRHISPFSKKQETSSLENTNVSILARLLPLCLCSDFKYEPYYCYKASAHLEITQVMPYFLLTSTGRLVLINKDFTQASMISDASLVAMYKNSFERMIELSKPLIQNFGSITDTISYGIDESGKDMGYSCCTICPEPNIECYITKEQIDSLIKRFLPMRGKIIEMAANFFSGNRYSNGGSTVICTLAGTQKLIDEGVLAFTPKEIMNPIPAELTKSLLGAIKQDLDNGVFTMHFTNPSKFKIPDNSVIRISRVVGIIIVRNTQEQRFHAIHISEDSIIEAFLDFVENINDSGLVHAKETSPEILESFINKSRLTNSGG